MPNTLRARVSFFAPTKDGAEVYIGHGQEIADDHEIVAGREDLFETVDEQPVKAKRPTKKAASRGAADSE